VIDMVGNKLPTLRFQLAFPRYSNLLTFPDSLSFPQELATVAVTLGIRVALKVGMIGGGYEIPVFVCVCFDIAGHACFYDVDGCGAG
jgi:hypothetical protein